MASSKIKGLTIEIGGDTTKLGAALKDAEKKSSALTSELNEINKQLKFNPDNVELLTQKQKVLADVISATRSRLDTLKEAEKQVQAQFERGEVSEEQVRALKREVIATEGVLKGYESQAEKTAKKIEKLGDSSDDAGNGLEDTGDEAKDAAKKVDKFGDSADDAGDSSGKLGEVLSGAAKAGLAAVAAAATAAIAGLVGAAESTREYRTAMGKLDTAFVTSGHTAEVALTTYRSLQGVLGDTDQAVEAANHLAKLADNEEDLAKWTDIATGVYATFGDSLPIEGLTEAANETAKVGQVTGPLADAINWATAKSEDWTAALSGNETALAAFNKATADGASAEDAFNEALAACSNEQERQQLITAALSSIYGDAADAYRETNAEIIRANEANEAWTASLAQIGGVIEPILTDVKMLGASLLSDLVPGVTTLAEAFRGLLSGDAGSADAFGAAFSGLITNLLAKIVELAPTVAEVALSLISTLVSSLVQALPQVLTTGGQIVEQLLTGIVSQLPTVAQKAIDVIGGFVSGLQTYLPLVLAKGSEILGNLGEGIRQNLPSLVSQALDVIMNFATTLYDNAPTLINTGFDLLSNLVQGILDSLPTLLSKAPEIVSKFANIINDNFPTILKKGAELILQIIKGIISAIPDLIANIPKIITAIVDVWEAFNWLSLGKKAITLLKDGILGMINLVKSAGKSIVDGATNAIKSLPGNLFKIGKSAISDLGGTIKNGWSTIKGGVASLMTSIVGGFKGLPAKLLTIGKDLVKGLWNGISDMTGWIINKIKSFGDNILGGIKKFFKIGSPSKVMRDEVGKWLPAGMAEGIDDNADAPIDSMAALSDNLLDEADSINGLTLERRLNTTFSGQPAASAASGLAEKLDRILAAIERGQVLTIDGKTLIGATADGYDNTLGQRRALAARGAL